MHHVKNTTIGGCTLVKSQEEVNISVDKILSYALRLAGSIEELAQYLSVSVPTIYAWRNGRRKPNRANLMRLEQYLQTQGATLYTIAPRVSALYVSETTNNVRHYDKIELFDNSLQPTGEWYAFRKEWVDKYVPYKDIMNLFLYKVDTDFMKPILAEGSIILVNTQEKQLISGKLYVFLFSTTLCIRRFFDTPTQYIFKVENSEFSCQNIILDKESIDFEKPPYEIIGRIIWTATNM